MNLIPAKLAFPATVADRFACVRRGAGRYQRAILDGSQRISGSDLRGKAGRYRGRYNASAQSILAKLSAVGIRYEIKIVDRVQTLVIIGL